MAKKVFLARNWFKSFKTHRVSKSKSTTCFPFSTESLVHFFFNALNDSHSQKVGGREPGLVTVVLIFFLDHFSVSYRDKTSNKKQRWERPKIFNSCHWIKLNWHLRFLNLCFYTKKQKAIVGYKVGFWLDEFSVSLRDKTRERERERGREREGLLLVMEIWVW